MSLPPDLPSYIRQMPDGSWQGGPTDQGPWRKIPAPQLPRHLAIVPPAPPAPPAEDAPSLMTRVFEAMAAADERAWGHLDAAAEHGNPLETLAIADRLAFEVMLLTIARDLEVHMRRSGVPTAAAMVAAWFDRQIDDARRGS